MDAVQLPYIPDSLLVYLAGERCPCGQQACRYKYYQAAMLFTVIRVLMGRN